MNLTSSEIDFLSAWAREEWEPACYQLPAHRLQLAHTVPGASLMVLIKAWIESERKKDHEIVRAATNASPAWPWASMDEFRNRVEEATRWRAHQETPAA